MTARAAFPHYADRARFEEIDDRADYFDPEQRIDEIRRESKTLRRYGEHAGASEVSSDLESLAEELDDYDCHDAIRLREEIREWIEDAERAEVSR